MRIKIFLLLLVILFLYGCRSENLSTPVTVTATETPPFVPVAPTATRQPEEWTLWNTSAHADTFDGGASSNTYCAQCHSPMNWKPDASVETASTVSKGEWRSIGCDVCHEVNGRGVSASLAWWDQAQEAYEPVSDSTMLCDQCHRATEMSDYQIHLGDSVHAGFACVTCHDPHSGAASCTNSGCHEGIRPESSLPPSTPTGGQHPSTTAFCGGANCHPAATQAALSNISIHGAVHASVSCQACHDASGMPVGPSAALGSWVTLRTADRLGVPVTEPFVSHDIQEQVDCSRCHHEGNVWGLPLVSGNEFGK